jgi:hypothetical protein
MAVAAGVYRAGRPQQAEVVTGVRLGQPPGGLQIPDVDLPPLGQQQQDPDAVLWPRAWKKEAACSGGRP